MTMDAERKGIDLREWVDFWRHEAEKARDTMEKVIQEQSHIGVEEIAAACCRAGVDFKINIQPKYPITAAEAFRRAGYTQSDKGSDAGVITWRKLDDNGVVFEIQFGIELNGIGWKGTVDPDEAYGYSPATTWAIFLQMQELGAFKSFMAPELDELLVAIREKYKHSEINE